MEINKKELWQTALIIGFMFAFLFAGAYVQYLTENFLITIKFILTVISLFTLFLLPRFVDLKTGMLKIQPKEEVQTPITIVESNTQSNDVAQTPTIDVAKNPIKEYFLKLITSKSKSKEAIDIEKQEIQFTTKDQIKDWLDNHKIEEYTINEDLTVDVDGHVKIDCFLKDFLVEYIPFKFNRVEGNFILRYTRLRTLKNTPDYIGGKFEITYCCLSTLEHSPKTVNGSYELSTNGIEIENCFGITLTAKSYIIMDFKIKSLEGVPETITGDFYCSGNLLKTLDYSPKNIGSDFNCSNNKIKTLKNGPNFVKGQYKCRDMYLKSLEGCPEHCYQFNSDNFSEQDYRNYNENRLAIEREKEATLLKQQLEKNYPSRKNHQESK